MKETLQVAKDLAVSHLPAIAADTWRLDHDIRTLRITLPKVRALIDRAEWFRFKDRNVTVLLSQLKDSAYDAEDLVDAFDYHELCQKLELSQRNQASQLASSAYDFVSDLLSGTAAKVKDIQARIDHGFNALKEVIDVLAWSVRLNEPVTVRPVTGPLETESEVFGRDKEKENLIELLLSPPQLPEIETSRIVKRSRRENVIVLPVVGIGGVGKTTLAQIVYNDPKVCDYFELQIWVSVSEEFNVARIMNEIIDCVDGGNSQCSNNMGQVQKMLMDKVVSNKFLLVLDNVWNDNIMEWEKLFAPLRYGIPGSTILITTRSSKVARIAGTMEPVILDGLPDDDYWNFLKICAFGFEHEGNHPELVPIAKAIAGRLKGSPLAAKTVGGLLRSNMDEKHWRGVMDSEMWELQQNERDILPALHLSYLYLPAQLKQCFLFCSIFPKDFDFDKDMLIKMWVAQGFVTPQGSTKIEEIGYGFLEELIARSFFQQSQRNSQCYVIHDLMHDLAQSVSLDECFRIHDGNYLTKIPTTVRHLSICTESMEVSQLMDLKNLKQLRSLVILTKMDSLLNSVIPSWFTSFTNLRLIKIDICEINELPESTGNLQHLRYLDISYKGSRRLPKLFYRLYNLQYLNLRQWSGLDCSDNKIDKGFSELVNLCECYPTNVIISRTKEIGKLTSLQSIPQYRVLKEPGYGISELKNLTQLHKILRVKNLENVDGKHDAIQAKLSNKRYLDGLTLEWSMDRNSNNGDSDFVVIEGLQPHPSLKKLEIRGYTGGKSPRWLQKQTLPCLNSVSMYHCVNIKELPSLTPLIKDLRFGNVGLGSIPRLWDASQNSFLSQIHIELCPKLTSLKEFLVAKYLPCVKSIRIKKCKELALFPAEQLREFASLEEFEIRDCPKLTRPNQFVFPSVTKKLELDSCGELGIWLPNCLLNLTSLTTLKIFKCPHIKSIPLEISITLTSLKYLTIRECRELTSLAGLQSVSSLETLCICMCPRLVQSEESIIGETELGGTSTTTQLKTLAIDNTALLRLDFLRQAPASLVRLEVHQSREELMFVAEEGRWLKSVKSLKALCFRNCPKFKSLPLDLHSLISLQTLHVLGCPEIKSLPKRGLPRSLISLHFRTNHPVLSRQLEVYKTLLKPSSNDFCWDMW